MHGNAMTGYRTASLHFLMFLLAACAPALAQKLASSATPAKLQGLGALADEAMNEGTSWFQRGIPKGFLRKDYQSHDQATERSFPRQTQIEIKFPAFCQQVGDEACQK